MTTAGAQRKRVLMLAESPYFGGITSHILAAAGALAHHPRYEPVVATLPGRREDNALIERGEALGVPVHVLPMSFPYDLRVIPALARFIRAERIDLVHTHNYRATFLAERARGSVPLINTCHGMQVAPTARLRLWQRLELRAMRKHPRVIACSNFVREWLAGQGVPLKHIRVVYNACPPPSRVPSDVTRSSLGIAEDDLAIVFVGRLAPGKGVEDLLKAVAGLRNISAVVVGDGPLRRELASQAEALGASVRFVGYSDNPGDYYALADAVVLPSHMEALPMTLVEAAAWGKPTVAAKAGGTPEVVHDGETGLLYGPGDVPGLQAALERMRDPALREVLGKAAHMLWDKQFSPARLAESLAKIYDEVAAS